MRAAAPVLVLAAATLGTVSLAAPMRSVAPTAAELHRGDSEGIGVTASGLLFLAPRVRPLGDPLPDGAPAHVWSAATEPSGAIYLGTGPEGKVLKVGSGGKTSVHFTAPEPMVTALAVLPDGPLLVATAPEGKIYRVGGDGRGAVWSETGERYVWALLPRPDGTVLAATGERGRLLRIDRAGKPVVLFDSDEAHLMSLSASRDGGVLAGGAGRGLVYRVSADGRARVLHDDDLEEARAVLEGPDGSVFVLLVAPPEPDRRPPALRIQMAGGAQVGTEVVGELDDRDGTMLRGVIEGLPTEAPETGGRLRGRVVRVAPDGTVRELWRSASEAPFALSLDRGGRAIFGTGEPARLYRVEPDDDVALLASLREGQVSALVPLAAGTAIATSNPASAYRLEEGAGDAGTLVSRPVDAGSASRWGVLRWRAEGRPGRAEFATRTGNSAEPDATWSDWSPALTAADGSRIPSPEGRFLQWRLRLFGSEEFAGRLHPATATFAVENRAPSVRDLRLDGASVWVSGKSTLRWSAFDPDGDSLAVRIEARTEGASDWSEIARTDPPAPKPSDLAGPPEASWRDGRASWDAASLEEGAYEIRAVASDAPSNPRGAEKEDRTSLPGLVVVDRTAPSLGATRKGDEVEVRVEDARSPVVRLEVLDGERVLFAPACLDGVCDSPKETFRFALPGPPGGRTLRAHDAAGNVAEAPAP